MPADQLRPQVTQLSVQLIWLLPPATGSPVRDRTMGLCMEVALRVPSTKRHSLGVSSIHFG
jgi:hypothetical protein